MERPVDASKTRRRIEDALRKRADEITLISVAQLLGVEIAYLPAGSDVPEIEKKIADLLGSDDLFIVRAMGDRDRWIILTEDARMTNVEHYYNAILHLLPARFTVYSVCFHTGPGIDEWEKKTRYFLTKQTADLYVPESNYFVNAHAVNLLEMREIIRSLEHPDFPLAPEELEVFKELKSTILS